MTKEEIKTSAEILAFELSEKSEEEILNKLMFWHHEAVEFFNDQMKKEVPAGIVALSIVSQA